MRSEPDFQAAFAAAREGDSQAFELLMEPLRSKIHAVAFRLAGPQLAEEIVMDTYLKAWKALPSLKQPGALSGWMCRIARNTAMDHLRRRQRDQQRFQAEVREDGGVREFADVSGDSPAARMERCERIDAVRRALQELPNAEDQRVLLLRYADDFSYREIAAATGIPIGTVMSRLFHAKRKLRMLLETGPLPAGKEATHEL